MFKIKLENINYDEISLRNEKGNFFMTFTRQKSYH